MEPITFLNNHFNEQIDAVLISRLPKKINVKYESTTEKLEYWPEMDKVKGFASKHLHIINKS